MPMKNRKRRKEEIAEDFCFVCKDGGRLLICEYKDCLKVYHCRCVGKSDSFLEKGDRWTCNWHSCFICHKTSKFRCFCCPKSVCGCCIRDAEFAIVRGVEGFCNECLKIALLVEENKDVDSEGGKVDFKNRDTYECLFMEYWEIVKEKESLTLELLHRANNKLKNGKNNKCGSESRRNSEDEEDLAKSEEENHFIISDYDDSSDMKDYKSKHKRKKSKKKSYLTKGKEFDDSSDMDYKSKHKRKKSKKKSYLTKGKEFVGWGSKPLLEFLASIGEDTTKTLSQLDATIIITRYCENNKLFHSEKKKKVLCDSKLQSLFGRKSVNRNKIHNLLEAHFAENFEQSEVDEVGYTLEDENANVLVTCKRQRKPNSETELQKKEVVLDNRQSSVPSIVAQNINLVYLKRSLVEELLKQPETFEGKVIGSFVRVKSDPNDILQKNSHQLMQVTGIKKTSSTGDNNSDILLELEYQKVPIQKISDQDFYEEECEDLCRRMKGGLLKMPTLGELEQKARSLHEDVTKYRIERELVVLQGLIDQANEKGWRREFAEYVDRRRLLQTHSEQMRLLKELPTILVDSVEPESSGDYRNSSGRTDAAGKIEVEGMESQKDDAAQGGGNVVKLPTEISGEEEDQAMRNEQVTVKKQNALVLSDDDEQDVIVLKEKRAVENPDVESKWHCATPSGKRLGPFPMSLLKRWHDSTRYDLGLKVWKTGQSEEEAVLVTDALHQLYPKE